MRRKFRSLLKDMYGVGVLSFHTFKTINARLNNKTSSKSIHLIRLRLLSAAKLLLKGNKFMKNDEIDDLDK